MMLVLVTRNKENQVQEFSCNAHSVENALNMASYISTLARQILEAFLIEEGKKTSLPVETFDGESFSAPIQQLEQQWQQILGWPVNTHCTHNQWFTSLTRQQIERAQARIDQLTQAITQVETTIQRIHRTAFHEFRRCQLLGQNESILKLYQQHLVNARAYRENVLTRLTQLIY